jgi:hypothetical protein
MRRRIASKSSAAKARGIASSSGDFGSTEPMLYFKGYIVAEYTGK